MNRIAMFGAAATAAAGLVAGVAALAPSAAETLPVAEVSHVHGIAVDPRDPARLYLATHHGLWRTAPDGTATRVSQTADDLMGFTPHPESPDRFYASGHPAGGGNLGLIASEDAGRTWTQLSPGADGPVDFHAMDVSPADPAVLYGLYGPVQVSRDGGRTWEIAGAPPADVFDVAASALDPDRVYAATRDGLFVSDDAGSTWRPAMAMRRPTTMVETTPDGTAYAFQVGTGLIRTTEPQEGWQAVGGDLGDRILIHLAVDPTDPARLYGVSHEGELLASADAGKSWRRFEG